MGIGAFQKYLHLLCKLLVLSDSLGKFIEVFLIKGLTKSLIQFSIRQRLQGFRIYRPGQFSLKLLSQKEKLRLHLTTEITEGFLKMDIHRFTISQAQTVNVIGGNPMFNLLHQVAAKLFIVQVEKRVIRYIFKGLVGKPVSLRGWFRKIHFQKPISVFGSFSLFLQIPESKKTSVAEGEGHIQNNPNSHPVGILYKCPEFFFRTQPFPNLAKIPGPIAHGVLGKYRPQNNAVTA